MGVGKDAAAAVLVRKYGFVRRAFADALKEEVIERFPDLLDMIAGDFFGRRWLEWRRETARGDLVWEYKPPLVRALLQNYGTDVRRRDTSGTYWIDKMEEWIAANAPERLVITDCRFLNEVAWLQHEVFESSYAVRVDRSQAPRISGHASEEEGAAAPWDYVLENSGSDLDSLERAVADMVRDLRLVM